MTRPSPRARGIFCNRTLNMRRIQAIGYDMDYTLIHYRMRTWEERAYAYLRERLAAEGYPVEDLAFDDQLVIRGLIIDIQFGNVVKADRFGYVKRAFHGTRPLSFDEQREAYQRTLIDLNEPRWFFLNTLFSISEACMFMQLVDLLDADRLPPQLGYDDLFRIVRRTIDETHMEGRLKAEIIANPERFVDLDPDMPLALLDQKEAGKKILLITNSEWSYAEPMLAYTINPFLPAGMTWKDLFDIAIVSARKPEFFTVRMPTFEVVTEDGLLREHFGPLRTGSVYVGSSARVVEQSLGLRGEEILYVGDHMFVDVNVSKNVLRWRTALILRELEDEIDAREDFAKTQREIDTLMEEKEALEREYSERKLRLQRIRKGYAAEEDQDGPTDWSDVREKLIALDERIAPLARQAGDLLNPNWGPLMRVGKDKSHLARQVERYADVYMSRVSNFVFETPFAYFRSHRGSLPHDSD